MAQPAPLPNFDLMSDEEIDGVSFLWRGCNTFSVEQRRKLLEEVRYQYRTFLRVDHLDHCQRYCLAWQIANRVNTIKKELGFPFNVSGHTVFLIIGTFLNREFVMEELDD
ncbi:hypothetical protein QAD02_002218 [Eretmocerus hayati]|uniref:Uncharacterized protein n=1 Tax=Eretmocerus hayati TaxID=131215 RepID=A0ACC2NI89_9HYME|nr:hypothetical protein QAD02_002218 [Eretmocerus hayati]